MRLRLVAVLGGLLLSIALVANEWLLAAVWSDDGSMEPLTVARVRLVQALSFAAGLCLLVIRRRLAEPNFVRRLIRDSPRTAASLTGLAGMVGIWLTAEVVCGFLLKGRSAATVTTQVQMADGRVGVSIAEPDPNLGYRLIRNLDARMRLLAHGGEVIYDIDVVTDAFGRRVTPIGGTSARPQYALFFGCSFTWGDAVRGDETLPAAFGQLADDVRPYNYAFRGYGPQQMLEQLRMTDVRNQVPEDDGIAVFTTIDEHVRRTVGSMRIVSGVRRAFPYYRLEDNGTVVRNGSFVTGRPWRQLWYDVLASSRVLEYFGFDHPQFFSERHLELVAAVIAEARDEYRRKFGNDRFVLVLYPGQLLLARLRPHLDRRGVQYFDYVNLFVDETRPVVIPGDGHPTPLAYRLVAEHLVRDIDLTFPPRQRRPAVR